MSDIVPYPAALIAARTDKDVVALYLSQNDDQGHPRFSERTLESYKRDIKRLTVFLDGKSFGSVTLEDVHAFVEWLKCPPPHLIEGNHRWPIEHANWRPFYQKGFSLSDFRKKLVTIKGLSPSALRQQLASIKAFYRWLLDTGYIRANPFGLMKSSKIHKSPTAPKRQLYKEDLHAVTNHLNKASQELSGKQLIKLARQRWLWFGYLLSGMRISELITHNTGHIYSEIVGDDKVWMIAVTGKGRKTAEDHPLPDAFVQELWRYRKSMGLDPWPNMPQPLVLSLSGKNALTSRSSAHNDFKGLIQDVAEYQENAGHHDSAVRLNNASTHWLRHSFVTCLLNVSSDIPAVSSLARHRDIKTTMGYDHSELPALKGILNEFASSLT